MEKPKVSIQLVKELREKTGVSLKYCLEALEATNLNMEEALSYLRKKGLEKAILRETKVAREGLVAVAVADDHRSGAIVEVNSETDFVANNDVFVKFIAKAAGENLKLKGNLAELQKELQDEQAGLTLQVGEKISINRVAYYSLSDGWVASYAHRRIRPSIGRVGVLMTYYGPDPRDPVVADLLKQIMMQIVAMDPIAVSIEKLDKALVEKQRNEIKETLQSIDKPIQILERMVDGKLRKYYETVVLLEQALAIDPKKRVKDLIEEVAKGLVIKNFVRFEVSK